eukprot:CAMPEP_0170111490 /NCGR_PEP_ID=MMETSP0020_2-20130122/8505_1 /TAXON_ID=98059 /ORGANISM="Dinobryon sp., Strain UTEXLB2267" /LENGTH=454 /DNA_ID=CAMNT_0010337027 /DNA_START=701 /DNA_END=2062 /DNA_ORIENTATION=-
MAVHFVFLVIVTIIPGRIIRMLAVTNMKLLELKQVFVRYVSHEIRSPLNVVHAGLDILRSELQSSSSVAGNTMDLVEDIYSASETAINILNDLLHYDHMDSGTFKLELSWRPLAGVWESKWKWAFLLAEKSDVTLTVSDSTAATELVHAIQTKEDAEIAAREVFLHIDAYKVDQVIRNLLTNAMKFTGSGGSVDVKISCQLQDPSNANSIASKMGVEAVGLLRVEVTDSGLGIAEEDQQRVFGQFAQFHQADLQGQGGGGGSGLGLWISRRIVHLHQGQMGFSSRGRGFGSSFFFELPLLRRPATYALNPPTCHSPKDTRLKPRPTRKMSIRVHSCDDDTAAGHQIAIPHSSSVSRDEVVDFSSIPQTEGLVGEGDADQETFQLTLESPVKLRPPPAEDSAPVPKARRILVVDDSAMNRKILMRLLVECERSLGWFASGVTVVEADDGRTAVEA